MEGSWLCALERQWAHLLRLQHRVVHRDGPQVVVDMASLVACVEDRKASVTGDIRAKSAGATPLTQEGLGGAADAHVQMRR